MVDPRGSDGYGEAFFRGAVGAWGAADGPDILHAVDALVEDGVADPQRIAIAGYSYGGFMTCWLTSRSDRFKAAVAGGGVADVVSMFGTSSEAFVFDGVELEATPATDIERLTDVSPIMRARHVNTPTLLLHGDEDTICPVGQAEQWFAALRSRGIATELVRYPGGSHLFPMGPFPSHRADFSIRIIDWLTRFIASPQPGPDIAAAPQEAT